jgi:hypothetical protein
MNKYLKRFLKALPFICVVIAVTLYLIPFSTQYFKINEFLKSNKVKEIKDNEKILDLPLYSIMINSSHNTYLGGLQNLSITSFDSVKFAIDAGARVIELDINKFNGKPVIAHGNSDVISTTYMGLDTMLSQINDYYKSSDPLFITVEIPDINNTKINEQIISIFKNVFGNRLLLPQKDVDYTTIPLRKFLNKIILLGVTDKEGLLNEIIHTSGNFIYLADDNPNLLKNSEYNAQFVRVYPSVTLGGVFSANFDPVPFREKYINTIALNFQTRDKYLFDNLKFFKEYSFIPRNEVLIS